MSLRQVLSGFIFFFTSLFWGVRIFLIQTYAVEDCLKYISTYSHTRSSANYGVLIHELSSLSDLEVSAKIKSTDTNGYAIGLSSKTGNVNVESDWGDYIRMFVGGSGKVSMAYLNNGSTNSIASNYTPSSNTFYNWKITYDDGEFKAYHENNLIGTLTTTLPSASKKVVLQVWNNNKTVTIEDLKVKPL